MKKLCSVVPAFTFAALSSLIAVAQQPQPAPNAPETTNAQLRPVNGELVTNIDSKKAKPGEPVVVKTTEKATTADGVVIPKGSKILGHVTDVQPHDKQNPNAKVTLQFDKAELKGGQTLPIQSVLESVAPPVNVASAGGVDTFGTGMPAAGGGSPMGGSPTGATPSGSPGVAPSTTPQAQGGTVANINSGTGDNNAPRAGTVVATQGNVAIKTTAIPGVLIAANANGQPFSNASGALLGAQQNVHLDGGTRVTLAIANIPARNPR